MVYFSQPQVGLKHIVTQQVNLHKASLIVAEVALVTSKTHYSASIIVRQISRIVSLLTFPRNYKPNIVPRSTRMFNHEQCTFYK
jgi:hypothetical protein